MLEIKSRALGMLWVSVCVDGFCIEASVITGLSGSTPVKLLSCGSPSDKHLQESLELEKQLGVVGVLCTLIMAKLKM